MQIGEEKPAPYKDTTTEIEKQLHAQLVTSSWCGLLAALTPLIDAATDESITENVLKAMQNYAALCGTLGNLIRFGTYKTFPIQNFAVTIFQISKHPEMLL